MATDCRDEFTLWKVGPQEVHVDFSGGQIVSDAGLLALRDFDKKIGFLAGLGERWPDPRAQAYVQHSKESLLVQQVYQILGGYADWNNAQPLRDDPLFRTLVGISPDQERGLASGSTLTRFHHAYTRRDAELPPEERPVVSSSKKHNASGSRSATITSSRRSSALGVGGPASSSWTWMLPIIRRMASKC